MSGMMVAMGNAWVRFLQVVIVLVGIAALAFLVWEPHLEGRNAHATAFQIYFNDPFVAYAYAASIAFFVALHQGFQVLGYVARGDESSSTIRAVRTIKYCALALIGFLVGAEAYFFLVVRGTDDIAGGVMMGLVLIVFSTAVAVAAWFFEKSLRGGLTPGSDVAV
jgi:hypothetical protein